MEIKSIETADELEFVIFCIENVAARLGKDGGFVIVYHGSSMFSHRESFESTDI